MNRSEFYILVVMLFLLILTMGAMDTFYTQLALQIK